MVTDEFMKNKISPSLLRDIPGWNSATVPICMFGDYRALSWCCKPGSSLTFGFKCRRDNILKELKLTPEEFMNIKDQYSKENNWDSELVCFGSISYCCMRAGGCPRRDVALVDRYPGVPKEEIMEIYFQKKKELSKKILESIRNQEGKDKIKPFLDMF